MGCNLRRRWRQQRARECYNSQQAFLSKSFGDDPRLFSKHGSGRRVEAVFGEQRKLSATPNHVTVLSHVSEFYFCHLQLRLIGITTFLLASIRFSPQGLCCELKQARNKNQSYTLSNNDTNEAFPANCLDGCGDFFNHTDHNWVQRDFCIWCALNREREIKMKQMECLGLVVLPRC